MVRISRFVSVVTTFVLATAISISPASATTSPPPTVTYPTVNTLAVPSFNLVYYIPVTPLSGSVQVTVLRTSLGSALNRTFVMADDPSVSILEFNPFLAVEQIPNAKIQAIMGTSSAAMPFGQYSITVSYNDGGNPAASLVVTGIRFTGQCRSGYYSGDGYIPTDGACTPAPLGHYVFDAGSTSSTICPAGFFAINEGSINCVPAPAGKFSAAGHGDVAPSDCAAGTYQPSQGQGECLPARTGHFVSDTAQITDLVCPAGTYQLEVGQASCLDAPAGTYVSETGAHATFDCVAGTFSASARSISCAQSAANFYVATVAATSATACPSGYTSPAGSDSLTDCIAPVVAATPPIVKSSPSMLKGKKRTLKSIAIEIKMTVPAKAKITATVAKASNKFCVVSGSSIKALKRGTCVVALKVKPAKGLAKSKTARVTIK